MKRLVILTVMTAVLAACGGGSSSVTPVTPNSDYAFFTSTSGGVKSLKAYDPDAALFSAIKTIPTTSLQYEKSIIDGTVDTSTLTTSNLHVSGVMFIDSGKIYSVSTAKSGGLSVTRHSSYSFSGNICATSLTNNYLVLTDSGSDMTCGNTNDTTHVISTAMSSSDTALTLPAAPLAVLFKDLNTVTGLLIFDNGNLHYTDAAGVDLISPISASSVSKVGSAGENVLLNVDGNLEIFDGATKTLSGSLYTVSPTGPLTAVVSDGTHYYFFDGLYLYSLAMDGKSVAQQITGVPPDAGSTSLTLTPVYVHNGILVYTTLETYINPQLNTRAVYAINMAGIVTPYALVSPVPDSVPVTIEGYRGNYLYYNIGAVTSANLTGNIAGAVRIDSTAIRVTRPGALWVGYSTTTSESLGTGWSRDAMILDSYTTDNSGTVLTGGSISVFDAATNTLRNIQGSLPAGMVLFSGSGFGDSVYGVFNNNTGSAYLAGLNVNVSNSLKQLDLTTAAVTDAPIF